MKHEDSTTRLWSMLWAFGAFGVLGLASGRAQTATTPAQAFVSSAAPSSGDAAGRSNLADQRIRFWQGQVARDPEFWESYNRLAGAFSQKARETGDISYFELAEGSLKKSLELDSSHQEAAAAFTQLTTVHLAEHRFHEASEDAAKAIALAPSALDAYPYAGDAQLELGNYAEAKTFYDRLVDPPDGMLHPGIEFLAASHGAGLHWIQGDTAQAAKDLEHAIELSHQLHMPEENIAWTQFMLGEQYFQAGDLVEAETRGEGCADFVSAISPGSGCHGADTGCAGPVCGGDSFLQGCDCDHSVAAISGGARDVYTAAGDKGNAEKQYAVVEFIGKLNTINQQVYNRELALFYADHDRKVPEALALAKKELEVRHDVYTSDAVAWALLKNGQAEAARVEMEKALRLGTQDAMLYFHAGMIDVALGDKAQAAEHLRRALAISPHFHVLFAAQATKMLSSLRPEPVSATAVKAD